MLDRAHPAPKGIGVTRHGDATFLGSAATVGYCNTTI